MARKVGCFHVWRQDREEEKFEPFSEKFENFPNVSVLQQVTDVEHEMIVLQPYEYRMFCTLQ
jgi:hypothetical protein